MRKTRKRGGNKDFKDNKALLKKAISESSIKDPNIKTQLNDILEKVTEKKLKEFEKKHPDMPNIQQMLCDQNGGDGSDDEDENPDRGRRRSRGTDPNMRIRTEMDSVERGPPQRSIMGRLPLVRPRTHPRRHICERLGHSNIFAGTLIIYIIQEWITTHGFELPVNGSSEINQEIILPLLSILLLWSLVRLEGGRKTRRKRGGGGDDDFPLERSNSAPAATLYEGSEFPSKEDTFKTPRAKDPEKTVYIPKSHYERKMPTSLIGKLGVTANAIGQFAWIISGRAKRGGGKPSKAGISMCTWYGKNNNSSARDKCNTLMDICPDMPLFGKVFPVAIKKNWVGLPYLDKKFNSSISTADVCTKAPSIYNELTPFNSGIQTGKYDAYYIIYEEKCAHGGERFELMKLDEVQIQNMGPGNGHMIQYKLWSDNMIVIQNGEIINIEWGTSFYNRPVGTIWVKQLRSGPEKRPINGGRKRRTRKKRKRKTRRKRTKKRRRKNRKNRTNKKKRRKRGGWEVAEGHAGVGEPCVDNEKCKKGLQCILGPSDVINARGVCKYVSSSVNGGKSRRRSK